MSETIGECEYCINAVNKEEILFALNELIDKRKREFEKIKKEMTEKKIIRPEDKYKHSIIVAHETLITRAERVRKRVENMLQC